MQHPLLNDVVLQNILTYLDFGAHLQFRQVCSKWKSVSEFSFWKKTGIKLHILPTEELETFTQEVANSEMIRRLKEFEDIFPGPGFPSDTISFTGFINEAVLETILVTRGYDSIKAIKMEVFFPINNHSLNLDPFLSPHLEKLVISEEGIGKPSLSFSKLTNVKHLDLHGCQVNLDERLSPQILDMDSEDNVFVYNGEKYGDEEERNSRRILLNDIFDFSHATSLDFSGILWKLDVSIDSPRLTHLHFMTEFNSVQGWSQSQWETSHLYFGSVEFYTNTFVKLNSLHLVSEDELNIFKLPSSINKLILDVNDSFSEEMYTTDQVFSYPHLKWLHLDILDDFPPLDFTGCFNLTDICIAGQSKWQYGGKDLNNLKFSGKISTLKLKYFNLQAKFPNPVDTLVLVRYKLKSKALNIRNPLSNVNAKQVAVFLGPGIETNEEKMALIYAWRNTRIEYLALGKFDEPEFLGNLGPKTLKAADTEGKCQLLSKCRDLDSMISGSTFWKLCRMENHDEILTDYYEFNTSLIT